MAIEKDVLDQLLAGRDPKDDKIPAPSWPQPAKLDFKALNEMFKPPAHS